MRSLLFVSISYVKLTTFWIFSFTGSGNIFRLIKRFKSPRGAIHLVHGGNRFVQYMYRDLVGHFRCSKFRAKCYVKLRVDEKMKFARETGIHNHEKTIKSDINQQVDDSSGLAKSKASSTTPGSGSSITEDFDKDVTADVELITNDRNVTLMFLKGFKFTKYFENRTHNRYEQPP